jgi:hypothetical protein
MLRRSIVLFVLLAATAACDKAPLGAPSGSSITLTAPARSVGPNGTVEITALVSEESGTPVQNGTSVRFSTNLGSLEPVEALTRNGVATTTFHAGSVSGVAQIRATSGAGGGGAGQTPTNVVEIAVGGAAATTLTLSSSALTVPPSGGSVTLVATVTDASGNRLAGAPVSFTTTAGTLSSLSATTNAAGEATATLTTNRTATVTARVGAGDAARTATVTINAAGNTIAVAVSPATVAVGVPVTLTVTPTVAQNNAASRVTVNWGDGTVEDLGLVATPRSVAHAYTGAGTYTITATATGDGDTASAATSVLVTPAPAPTVTVTPASGPSATTTFTFTITPAANQATQNVSIDFGDGSAVVDLGAITSAATVTHRFPSAGTWIIRVTQTNANGTSSTVVTSVSTT